MLTARVSEPSVSTSAAAIESGTALSSLPAAGLTVSVGASATGLTVTASGAAIVALLPLATSLAVALAASVKSTSLCEGGVTLRVAKFQPVMTVL